MYLDFLVGIASEKGKITTKPKGNGTFVLMIDKIAIFILVMIVISLLTHVIMHSKCRIYLGAR